MGDEERAVYVISVAAELIGMHPQTLRMYEREGLVAPERTPGGSRRYSDRDLQTLRKIHDLSVEGVGIAGIKRVLALQAQLEMTLTEVRELEKELEDARRETERKVMEVRKEYRGELVPIRHATVVRVVK